ncbi:Rrf2 family transcriptional regulator [Candidatus Poribacteria bacterium]|nr:Rrf2 family transcriptional regulator [Candidatus Poribacteria bacterium]
MLSYTIEYALRAAICLAQSEQGMTTARIAEIAKVPADYLAKVMQMLRKAKLVHAQRGLGGGYRLRREPSAITLLEVVNAVDPIERIHTCPLELESHGVALCPLHRRLDDAIAQFERAFSETTLADILETPTSSPPMCDLYVLPGSGGAR